MVEGMAGWRVGLYVASSSTGQLAMIMEAAWLTQQRPHNAF